MTAASQLKAKLNRHIGAREVLQKAWNRINALGGKEPGAWNNAVAMATMILEDIAENAGIPVSDITRPEPVSELTESEERS